MYALLALLAWLVPGCTASSNVDADVADDADAAGDADLDIEADTDEPTSELGTWVWDLLGSEGRQYANALAEAEDGGVYLGGFHDGSPSSGWLARIDPDGRPRWEGLYGNWIASVASHPEGGVVIVGDRAGSPTYDGLVAWIGPDGAPEWRLRWDLEGSLDRPSRVEVIRATPEGTFVIAGTLTRFDAESQHHLWTAELTAAGELLWQRTLAEGDLSRAALTIADGSDVLVAIKLRSEGVLLARLDRRGDPRWARQIGAEPGMGTDSLDVVETPDGDVVVVASHQADVVVLRFDADGTLRWQRAYDSGGFEYGTSALALAGGELFLAGAALPTSEGPDLWVAGLDQEGELIWQELLEHQGCEVAHGLVRARDGNVIIATGGCEHAMVVRLRPDGGLGEGCDLLSPSALSEVSSDLAIEEVRLTPEDTALAPTLTGLAFDDTTSTVEVLCEPGVLER